MKARRCQRPGHRVGTFRIPTTRKQGYDIVVGRGEGLIVREGTPRPEIETLHPVGRAVMKNPAVIKFQSDSGASVITSKSPGDFSGFLKSDITRFARVITKGNIQKDKGVVF